MNLGYCCINLTLREDGINTNRKMIKRTFEAKGIEGAGELALQNIRDLFRIIQWNQRQGIKIFRMSSDLFPWMSEYEILDLPNITKIKHVLAAIGHYAIKHDLRIGFHPGQFDVLASPREDVVIKTIKDLDQHSQILDLMGLPVSYRYSLNIHVGGTYGDKVSALERFRQNFKSLSHSTQQRLVVENDDKPSQYSVKDLHEELFLKIGTPITFDFFHHQLHPDGLTTDDAARLAASTWPEGVRPLAHYSSSKKLNEVEEAINRAHADFIYEEIPEIGVLFDIELEAKAKEQALLRYQNQFIQRV